jgi:hypothetical protein
MRIPKPGYYARLIFRNLFHQDHLPQLALSNLFRLSIKMPNMSSIFYGPKTNRLTPRVRMIAALSAIIMIIVGMLSTYLLWSKIFTIFGRIYRSAPAIEVPYLMFGLLMTPTAAIILTFAAITAAITGKLFDPPKNSWPYRFSVVMFSISGYIIIYAVPTVATLTTLTLHVKGYWTCRELRPSGSGWQVFWVNDERVCFKPDEYINDNWPCRNEGNKLVCIQVDGR